jgi:hypothetical protein
VKAGVDVIVTDANDTAAEAFTAIVDAVVKAAAAAAAPAIVMVE